MDETTKLAEAYPAGTHVALNDQLNLFDDINPDAVHLVTAKVAQFSNHLGCRSNVAIYAGVLQKTSEKVTCLLCIAREGS